MNYVIWTYGIYSAAAIGLTTLLARTLSKNGAVFLSQVFSEAAIAKAVNQLLVIGFYMLNLGYAFLIFKTNGADTGLEATENLITKLGLLLVSLGLIHFVNMAVFWKIKKSGERVRYVPPTQANFTPPTNFTPPPPTAGAVRVRR